jgi:predicted nucleotidyltransferase
VKCNTTHYAAQTSIRALMPSRLCSRRLSLSAMRWQSRCVKRSLRSVQMAYPSCLPPMGAASVAVVEALAARANRSLTCRLRSFLLHYRMIAQAPSRSDVQARIQAVHSEILGLGVRRLALFGSVRHDAAGPDSDVDLLVEFLPEQKTLAHLVELGDLLESVLGRRVELVTPEALSPFLRPHILADAVDVVQAA